MSAAPRSAGRKRAQQQYDQIAARNEPVRQAIRRAVQLAELNHPTGEFLHWLLSQCHEHTYCALPKPELATLYGMSLSSIKLYLRTAAAKGFVRLSGVRIYFVQLEANDTPTHEKTRAEVIAEATALAEAGNLIEAALLLKQAAAIADEPDEASDDATDQAASFCDSDESKNCLNSDNSLSDDPLKTLKPSGGGGKDQDSDRTTKNQKTASTIPDTPQVAKLQRFGVRSPTCWIELHDRPIAELDHAWWLAQQVRDPDDLAALTVDFARQLRDGLITIRDQIERRGMARKDAEPPSRKPRGQPAPINRCGACGHHDANLRHATTCPGCNAAIADVGVHDADAWQQDKYIAGELGDLIVR